jgi:hypothetical protein
MMPRVVPAPFTQFAIDKFTTSTTVRRKGQSIRRARVKLELENDTAQTRRYRIVPAVLGMRWTVHVVRLRPGQRWSKWVVGVVPRAGCSARLVITLDAVTPRDRVSRLTLPLQAGLPACRRGRGSA